MLNLFMKLNPVANGIIGIILAILILTIFVSITLKNKYSKLEKDITDSGNRSKELFENELFNNMVKDYKKAIGANTKDINTQAIIEKNMYMNLKSSILGERFLMKSISLMIILGLLGTFYGLTLSIGELVSLLNNTDAAVIGDVQSITGGLVNSIRGMSVAFVTSLFGIASSIIVTLINIGFSVKEHRESIMVYSEEYLDNLGSKQSAVYEEETGRVVSVQGAVGDTSGIIRELTNVSEKIIKEMNRSAYEMSGIMTGLNKSVENFDSSLKMFADGTRDLREFNHELRTNIQRMNVSFDDFNKNISRNVENISESSNNIVKLSVAVEKLGNKLR